MSDLPPGFVLDPPKAAAGLPPGFVLDGPPRPVGAAMAIQQPRPQLEPGPRTPQAPSRPWSSVPGEAVRSIPESAWEFAKNIVQPIVSPVQTANALYAFGKGVVASEVPQEMAPVTLPNGQRVYRPRAKPETDEERRKREDTAAPAVAVKNFFADRYGTEEGFKNTLATDPVGVAADVATILTGGGALAVRAPGIVGKAGQIASKVGQAVDPLSIGIDSVRASGRAVESAASNALGLTTGAGAESVRAAGRAGREGGDAANAFVQNMRGNVPTDNIVDLAKSGLEKIRQERADAYKAGKVDLSRDATVIPFDDIDRAIAKGSEVGSFKGVNINRPAGKTMDEISAIVSEWKALDPAIYHTPEGLDALKRSLGAVRDSAEYGSPARVAADRVYNAVKAEITRQAPAYARMMEDYAVASDKIKEVTRTFSLGERATGDTAVRKLQAATRDGANTNWRNRGELLNELSTYVPELPYAIAGQATNALLPRGIVARGGAMLSSPTGIALPAFSPRIVGETVYLGGRAVGLVDDVAEALGITAAAVRAAGQGSFQAGRVEELTTNALALRRRNETKNALARP